MIPRRFLCLILVTGLFSGCGDDTANDAATSSSSRDATSNGWPASCDTRAQGPQAERGLCRAWSGEETGDFATLCTETYQGLYSTNPCSEALRVGRCDTDQGFGLFLSYHYYEDAFDEASARAHCEGLASCQFSCAFVAP